MSNHMQNFIKSAIHVSFRLGKRLLPFSLFLFSLNAASTGNWEYVTNYNLTAVMGYTVAQNIEYCKTGDYSWNYVPQHTPSCPEWPGSYSVVGNKPWRCVGYLWTANCQVNVDPCPDGKDWNQVNFSCESTPPPPVEEEPDPCGKVSNPIYIGTGSKTQTETDFFSASSSLAITRQYYSNKRYVDGLGNYWTGSWEWNFVSNRMYFYTPAQYSLTNGLYNTSGYTYIGLARPGGVRQGFKYLGNNMWQATGLKKTSLSERINSSNAQQIELEYVVTDASGDQEIYNNKGSLIETISVNGRHQLYVRYTDIDALPDIDKLTITDQPSGQSISFIYNDMLRVVQAIDTDNQTYTYEYTDGLFQFEIGPNSFIMMNFTNLTKVTFPDNNFITYLYENSFYTQLLTGITDEENKRFATWKYNTSGAYSSEHGNGFELASLAYTHDTNAPYDIVSVTNTNAVGKETKYHLNKVNGRNLITQVEGIVKNTCLASDSYYGYDTNGYRKTVTDKNGNVTETLRNNRGLIETERTGLHWVSGINSTMAETEASQKTVTVWHATLALPLERTYYGWNGSAYEAYKKEATAYTGNNRIATFTVTDLTTLTVPYGRTHVWIYTYSYYDVAQTQLQQQIVNGPRTDVNDITTYNYDAAGNLSSMVNALGQATLFGAYNARGLLGSITDANNNVTGLTYTVRGWLDVITVNGTAVTNYDYYANGLLQKVTLPDGSWLSYTYNDARHLTGVENNLGEMITYTPSILDGKWTQEVVKNSSNTIVRQRQRVFDELGRVMTLQGQNGQSWQYSYDANDNLDNENDALQQVTSYQYDAQNRIKETLDAEQNSKTNAADKHAIAFVYDGQGNIKTVTDQRGNTTSYGYDGFGELIQQTSPDTGVTTFTYDAYGNLTGKTDARGVNAAYQYDALNRLTATLHVGNPSEDITYTYDAILNGNKGLGRLTGYTDANGSTSLAYDAWGLSETVFCAGLQCYGTQSVHNSAGQLTSLIYPSGNSVIYGYDALGRVNAVSYQQAGEALQNITDPNAPIEYYPFGGMKKITYANGVEVNISNDTDGRITTLTASGISSLYSKSYGHTVTNNIASIADVENTQNSRTYTYDKVSRLTTAIKGAVNPVTSTYTYDEAGNRTTKQVADSTNTILNETLNYPASSNRLDAVTDAISSITKTYTYDAAGNITLQAKNIGNNIAYSYSEGNRMSVSNVTNGAMTSYVYNALGQRIVKLPNGDFSEATYYHYDLTGKLLAEHNMESTLLLTENIYVNGIMLVQMDARKVDSDNDGWFDNDEITCGTNVNSYSSLPLDTDGDLQCNNLDMDDDNDGLLDAGDACPVGITGLGNDLDNDGCKDVEDLDDDNDGLIDAGDACPSGLIGLGNDHDSDGCKDVEDLDDDNDTLIDIIDACPVGLIGIGNDLDNDGCKTLEDADDDGDGLVDTYDACPSGLTGLGNDLDSDGCKNPEDTDDDNDSRMDASDACPLGIIGLGSDYDKDGCKDPEDTDDDNDGLLDTVDTDDDNDGVSDAIETANGLDISNPLDTMTDLDGDGYSLGQELVQGSNPNSFSSTPSNEQYSISVVNGENDVESTSSGTNLQLHDTDLNLDINLNGNGIINVIGLRFAVPFKQNAEIVSSSLEVQSLGSYSGSTTVQIALENSVDAALPSSNFIIRSYFGNTIAWSPSNWSNNAIYQSVDVSSLLGQVTSNTSWLENNHVFFKLTMQAGSYRKFGSYERSVTNAPKLKIAIKRPKWNLDNDGLADMNDACPVGMTGMGNDLDNDGCKNAEDDDDDNDGLEDSSDICPLGVIWLGNDLDNDGCKNVEDADDDNDALLDTIDACPLGIIGVGNDYDNDGCKNAEDDDDDNDGVTDVVETANGLNTLNPLDTMTDLDGDGYSLGQELMRGSDPANMLSIPANEQYSIGIENGQNDVESDATGANLILDDTNLDLNVISGSTNIIGLRFALPFKKNAEIVSSSIKVKSQGNYSFAMTVQIALENSVDAALPTSNFVTRSYLASTLSWVPSNWNSNSSYQTVDVSSLLSQVTANTSWVENNHVFFTLTRQTGSRAFDSYEASAVDAPKLNIVIKPQKWDYDNDGFVDGGDNCPIISNILQIDSDADGKGDDCDAFPNDPLQF